MADNRDVKILHDAFVEVCESFRNNYFCIGCPMKESVCENEVNSQRFKDVIKRISDETCR